MNKSVEKWFKSHDFPYVRTEDGTYYWQTAISTGEMDCNGNITWHEKYFFEVIKKKLDKQPK